MRLRIGLMLGIGAVAVATACAPAPPPTPPVPPPPSAPSTPFASSPPPAPPAPVAPVVPVLRIMPLGDSITYGLGSSNRGGYRVDLARRFAAAGFQVDFVGSQRAGPLGADDDNEGHGGWRIAQLAAGVSGWLAGYRPDVVLLHAGTNDLHTADSAAAATRLGLLVNRIRRDAPTTQVFVARIIGSRRTALQRRINDYNADVARLVIARQDPLVVLVNQALVRAPDVHPNDAGYAVMARNWFAAVASVDRPAAEPVPTAVPAIPFAGCVLGCGPTLNISALVTSRFSS
jgi:lysophospholipase L1-like esterase